MSRKKPDKSDFTAEIESHLALEAERLRESGLSEEEARSAARRAFGNRIAAEERFWEANRWLWWDHFWQDLRLAARLLAKTPVWTAIAASTVALGIGAAATIFSIVNAALIRPLPFPHPEQLYWVTELLGRLQQEVVVAGDYLSLRDNNHVFQNIAASSGGYPANWTGIGRPRQIDAIPVTASFFPLFGVQPLYGRFFRPDEDRPGTGGVAILGYRFWLQAFGGDPAVIGRVIRLDRKPTRIIGVMPRAFDFPKNAGLWVPMMLDETHQRPREKAMLVVQIFARSRPGVTPPQIAAELGWLTGVVLKEWPKFYFDSGFIQGLRIYARPLQEQLTGHIRPALLVFSGAAALMLLIVCFNVAGLTLARAAARRREIAVRLALGAPRWRIVRQLLTESLLVSLLGGSLGIALAALTAKALSSSRQLALAGLPAIRIDAETALFVFALTLATGLIFGLVPAFGSLGSSIREALHRETPSATSSLNLQRMRKALVVAQLGLSLTLLIGAGLLAKSFLKIRNTDPGFRPEHVLTARIALTGPAYATMQRQIAFFRQAMETLHRIPGIQSICAADAIPLSGDRGGSQGVFQIENRPPVPPGKEPQSYMERVSLDFFKTMSIPLLKGRLFTPRDAPGSRQVSLINEAFARRFFPNEDPLGQRISLGVNKAPEWLDIVGVVRNIRQFGLGEEAEPEIYTPLLQPHGPGLVTRMALLIRSSSDPLKLIPAIQKTVTSLDPDELIYDVKTMDQRLSDSLGPRRFDAILTGCFALIAAILSAIGLYVVMSYLVTLRTKEMSIRQALGAQPRQILGMVLREGLALGSLGSALGIAGALALSGYLSRLLYGITTHDPATFAIFTLTLFAVVLAACYFPGRRAVRTDPVAALRHD